MAKLRMEPVYQREPTDGGQRLRRVLSRSAFPSRSSCRAYVTASGKETHPPTLVRPNVALEKGVRRGYCPLLLPNHPFCAIAMDAMFHIQGGGTKRGRLDP
jgi:hypothetical protein